RALLPRIAGEARAALGERGVELDPRAEEHDVALEPGEVERDREAVDRGGRGHRAGGVVDRGERAGARLPRGVAARPLRAREAALQRLADRPERRQEVALIRLVPGGALVGAHAR